MISDVLVEFIGERSMSVLLFNLLWLIPIFVFYLTRKQQPFMRVTIRSMSVGAVIWQASKGLLGFGFLGKAAVPVAFIAYMVESIHQFFIYEMATLLGVISAKGNILGVTETLPVIVFGVVFCIVIYGLIGLLLGRVKSNISG